MGWNFVSAYTFDPNGIPIKFSHNVEGVEIRKHPVMVDTAPSDITKEGPDPVMDKWLPVENPTAPDARAIYPGEGTQLVKGRESIW